MNTGRFFYRCYEYRSCHGLSPADSGFCYDKAAVFGETVKERTCSYVAYYSSLIQLSLLLFISDEPL
jgi:hypothetical protein